MYSVCMFVHMYVCIYIWSVHTYGYLYCIRIYHTYRYIYTLYSSYDTVHKYVLCKKEEKEKKKDQSICRTPCMAVCRYARHKTNAELGARREPGSDIVLYMYGCTNTQESFWPFPFDFLGGFLGDFLRLFFMGKRIIVHTYIRYVQLSNGKWPELAHSNSLPRTEKWKGRSRVENLDLRACFGQGRKVLELVSARKGTWLGTR